jgi:uncharacterized RDD family membrane protein YckC
VIDPGQLAADIAGNAVSLALPGLLWAALFLLAFEHGPFAASLGLGRRAFWLLLPGAIASTFADLPFVPIGNDLVGIGLAGALFPILVALLTFARVAPPARRSLRLYGGGYAVLAAATLAVVLVLSRPWEQDVGVLAVAVGLPAVLLALAPPGDLLWRRVGFLLAITDGVALLTFLFSAAVPGVGITEGFPQYLLPPVAAGAVAVLFAPLVFRGEEALGLAAAFVASTFGVLVGADVLRQPPLYPSSQPGLYVIGGAGVSDLVYLSGLLALATAFLVHQQLGRGWEPVGGFRPANPTPVGRLARSFRAGVRGDLAGSLAGSDLASRQAAAQTRQLFGVPEPPSERPWQGLPVPGWVVSDQANLDAVAKSGTSDGRESFRGWLMARSLVVLAMQLNSRRFASAQQRALAYGVDLAIVLAPAVALWSVLAATTHGGFPAVIQSVGYNAAIYGFIALAFLYFVIAERAFGTTPGKTLFHLMVRERGMRPPSLLAVLLRNSFKVPTLTILGVGISLATALGVAPGGGATASFGGVLVPIGALAAVFFVVFVALGVGLLGAIAFLTISATSERQRCGDLVAGTWVLRVATPVRPAPRTAAPVPRVPGSSG